MKRILITTGGTGGHIYPALSLAEQLKKEGNEIVFVGTKHRMERELIPNENYKFYGLDIVPFRSVKSVLKLFKGIFEAIKIIRKENIDEVVGFGNYISLPSLIAAKILFKKVYLQEQNVSMGQANKFMYRFSNKVFLAFRETLKFIPKKYENKFVVTGNPLRKEFYNVTKEEARKLLNISSEDKVICVMGGSLGAKNINNAILEKIDEIRKSGVKLYWATGKDLYEETVSRVSSCDNVKIVPYFENSFNIMAACDLLLCRAGASTISEIIELEKPSILIPYNFVGQKENSEILEIVKAALVYTNEEAGNAILDAINLIQDNDRLEFMKDNIRSIKPGNAVLNILNNMGE